MQSGADRPAVQSCSSLRTTSAAGLCGTRANNSSSANSSSAVLSSSTRGLGECIKDSSCRCAGFSGGAPVARICKLVLAISWRSAAGVATASCSKKEATCIVCRWSCMFGCHRVCGLSAYMACLASRGFLQALGQRVWSAAAAACCR